MSSHRCKQTYIMIYQAACAEWRKEQSQPVFILCTDFERLDVVVLQNQSPEVGQRGKEFLGNVAQQVVLKMQDAEILQSHEAVFRHLVQKTQHLFHQLHIQHSVLLPFIANSTSLYCNQTPLPFIAIKLHFPLLQPNSTSLYCNQTPNAQRRL